MDYRSLFKTAFDTLRRARSAWLFSLLIGGLQFLSLNFTSIESSGLLACSLLLLGYYLSLVSSLAITLSLYHSYDNQPATVREIWAEANHWLLRYSLFLALSIVALGIPWVPAYLLVLRRLPYALFLASSWLPAYFAGFLFSYAVLSMIRRGSATGVLGIAWALWKLEHGAKFVLAVLYAILVMAPNVAAALIEYPATSMLTITSQQYSLAMSHLPFSLVPSLLSVVLIPAWAAVTLSLYMSILRRHPELDPARNPLVSAS